jgi:hypothetical protein
MANRVYLETSVVSYLTSRPGRDLVVAAHQQITREWWEGRRESFELFVSEALIEEAGAGDPEAAALRLRAVEGLPVLEVNDDVTALALALVSEGVLPPKAALDAVHIAVAAVGGMDIFLTWNCTHLANAETMGEVAKLLWSKGFAPPIMCTPEELMGGEK